MWLPKLTQRPMLGWSSNISAGSITLAQGQPLRLRHPRGRSRASHITLKDYCNKRNNPNSWVESDKTQPDLISSLNIIILKQWM